MFLACRHIKPNGVRCESPALRGHSFCYFHAKLHSTTRIGVSDDFRLPLPEDAAGGWPRSRMTLPNHDDGAPRSLAFSDRGWKQNSSTPSTTPAFGNPLESKAGKTLPPLQNISSHSLHWSHSEQAGRAARRRAGALFRCC